LDEAAGFERLVNSRARGVVTNLTACSFFHFVDRWFAQENSLTNSPNLINAATGSTPYQESNTASFILIFYRHLLDVQ
jgi:hypothetical protein